MDKVQLTVTRSKPSVKAVMATFLVFSPHTQWLCGLSFDFRSDKQPFYTLKMEHIYGQHDADTLLRMRLLSASLAK